VYIEIYDPLNFFPTNALSAQCPTGCSKLFSEVEVSGFYCFNSLFQVPVFCIFSQNMS
jgi:hypothetical protein